MNNDTLRVLDVENPRLFSLQAEHCTHFGKMLAVNPSLTEIYFGKFRFRDSSLELFLDDVAVDQLQRSATVNRVRITASG